LTQQIGKMDVTDAGHVVALVLHGGSLGSANCSNLVEPVCALRA
jgi:hypothetical protein